MAGIFISYRRDDAAGHALNLHRDLVQRFGRDLVFMDITALEPGLEFGVALDRAVSTCDVFLAVIGPRWPTIADAAGRPRLENPDDFVRREVATALARGNIRVIPVLVGNAAMPRRDDLPEPLRALSDRHAFEISDERWDYDMGRLIERLEPVVQRPTRLWRPTRRQVLPFVVAIAGGGAFALWRWMDRGPDLQPSELTPMENPTRTTVSTVLPERPPALLLPPVEDKSIGAVPLTFEDDSLYLDEAGDTGFKFERGSSRYFVVVLLLVGDPFSLQEATADLRKELGLPDDYEFKFYHSEDDRRLAFLEMLQGQSLTIRALVVDKSLMNHEQMRERDAFYNYLVELVLERGHATFQDAMLILNSSAKSRHFKQYLASYLRKALNPYWGRPMIPMIRGVRYHAARSDDIVQADSVVQAADMVAGAVYAKYSRGDDQYLEVIRENIKDLWEWAPPSTPIAIAAVLGAGWRSG